MIHHATEARAPARELPRLTAIPGSHRLTQLVNQLEDRWSEAASVQAALTGEGWTISEHAFSAGSTLRAVLTPLRSGRFAVAINANFEPSLTVVNWLLCHEVGHAILRGRHGDPAWRLRRDTPSQLREERFCNRLADRLVGQTALSSAYRHAS